MSATLGNRLRRARREAGYATATAASEAFGWNRNSYKSAENDARPPSRDSLLEYANAFQVSLDWLALGRGPMHPNNPRGKSSLRQIPLIELADIAKPGHLRQQLAAAKPRGFIMVPDDEPVGPLAFFVTINDDAMDDPRRSRQRLMKGDRVLVDPDAKARITPGCLVCAQLSENGKAIRKLYVVKDDGKGIEHARIKLVSLHPGWPNSDELSGNVIVGPIVLIQLRP